MAESIQDALQTGESHMKDALQYFHEQLKTIRAGKASPQMFEKVMMDYYGSQTPIGQASTIVATDARTLTITPFEKQHLSVIERAIVDANLGVSPQNDGTLIRVNLPTLTEERRKDLTKQASSIAEEARVSVRNARRDANDALKKLQKDGESEDSVKAAEGDVQKLTDKYIAQVDEDLKHKEAEIMKV